MQFSLLSRLLATGGVLLLAAARPALSADADPTVSALEQDGNAWTTMHFNHVTQDGWLMGIGINNRVTDNLTNFRRSRVRLQLGNRLSERGFWRFGADRIENYNPENHENRLWQQAQWQLPIESINVFPAGLELYYRARFEERFVSNVSGMMVRTRHRLNTIMPLRGSKQWYFRGWNEVFLNVLNQPEWPRGNFEQNRLFLGLGFKPRPGNRLEAGYQVRYMNLEDRPDRIDHILFLQWYHEF